jgi:hypothetical protein
VGRLALRGLVCVALLALTWLGAVAATAAARSGVTGHVGVDGGCIVPGTQCEKMGIPATIQIQRARSGQLVRTVHTSTGRFHVRLRPGRYRLHAMADNGNGAGSARVRVRRHHFTVVVLSLHSPAP